MAVEKKITMSSLSYQRKLVATSLLPQTVSIHYSIRRHSNAVLLLGDSSEIRYYIVDPGQQ